MPEYATKAYVAYSVSAAGLKGEKGDKGNTGASGAAGAQGAAGPAGADGAAATISIGSVTTGAAGTSAAVTNSGTSSAAVFNFTIPRGAQGVQGLQGPQGEKGDTGNTGATGAAGKGIASVVLTGGNHEAGTTDTYTITFTDSTTATFSVYNGADGSESVISVNGQSGTVILDADDIGDGSAAHKFVTASDLTKLGDLSGTNTGDETAGTIKTKLGITTLSGSNTGDQDLSSYARLSSPALTGTPTAPTAATGTDTTQIATTGFVQDAVSSASALPLAENLPVSEYSDDAGIGEFAWVNTDGEAVFPPSSSAVSTGISSGTYAGCYVFEDYCYILTINPVSVYKFDNNFNFMTSLSLDSATSVSIGLGLCFSQAGIGHVFYTGSQYYYVYETSFDVSTMTVVTVYRQISSSGSYTASPNLPPCFMSFANSVTMVLPMVYNDYNRPYLFTVADMGTYARTATAAFGTSYDMQYCMTFGNVGDGYVWCSTGGNALYWFTSLVTEGVADGFSYASQSFGNGAIRGLIGFKKPDGSYAVIVKRYYSTTGTQYYAISLTSALVYSSYETLYTNSSEGSYSYASPSYAYDDGTHIYFFMTLSSATAFGFYRIKKSTYAGASSLENVTNWYSSSLPAISKAYTTPFWLMAKGAPHSFSLAAIHPYPAFIDEVTDLGFLGVVHSINEDHTINVQQSGPINGAFDWNGNLYIGYDVYGTKTAHSNPYNRVLTRLSDSCAMLNCPDSSASSFAESGFYTGTGTYGSSNKSSLTFLRKHKFVVIYMICASSAYTTQYQTVIPWMSGSVSVNLAGSAVTLVVSSNEATLSWYHASSAASQLNTSSKIYYYYAAD